MVTYSPYTASQARQRASQKDSQRARLAASKHARKQASQQASHSTSHEWGDGNKYGRANTLTLLYAPAVCETIER
jgi:hypothetical protein